MRYLKSKGSSELPGSCDRDPNTKLTALSSNQAPLRMLHGFLGVVLGMDSCTCRLHWPRRRNSFAEEHTTRSVDADFECKIKTVSNILVNAYPTLNTFVLRSSQTVNPKP